MTDKKSIVIKLKYSTPKHQDQFNTASAKITPEWNIRRIVMALIIIILILALGWSIHMGYFDQNINKLLEPAEKSDKRLTINELMYKI